MGGINDIRKAFGSNLPSHIKCTKATMAYGANADQVLTFTITEDGKETQREVVVPAGASLQSAAVEAARGLNK